MNTAESRRERSPQLTEYALVVLVMGTIGLVGYPRPALGTNQYAALEAQAAETLREVDMGLALLRGAILDYRAEHRRFPGYVVGSEDTLSTDAFIDQLTELTDGRGALSVIPWAPRNRFGPYLWELPINPVNRKASVRLLGPDEPFPAIPRGRTGWIYQPVTGELRINTGPTLPGTQLRLYDHR